MSEKLLGLRENPFAAGHDPRFIHRTPEREEALARLRHGLSGGEPFLLVTGEPGIGKDSLVRQALDDETMVAAFIPRPALHPRELLEEICIRFEIALHRSSSKPQVMARLEKHLTEQQAQGKTPVLVLDEAQDASPELLEELRLLSNLEVEGRPLLQIVLMGQPDFERRLGGPEMVRLRQRVATHCRLAALSAEETIGYIHTRVGATGGDGSACFPSETCLEIHRLARGVPRAINTIAGEALLKASRESATSVLPEHVQASAADSWLRSVSDGLPPPIASRPRDRDDADRNDADRPDPNPLFLDPVSVDMPRRDQPEVKEWVSRFVDASRPLQIGGQILAERAAETSRREWEEVNGPMVEDDAPPLPAGAVPRPKPRRRSRSTLPGRVPLALAAIVLAGLGAFQIPRWLRRPPREATAPAAGATVEPAAQTAPAPSPVPAPAVAARTPATPAKPPAPRVRRGIEAGSYLNSERAQAERTLLAETTGLPVQVIEGTEDGATVYRVVVGSFGSRRKALRTLNELVDRGLVEQARVVSLPAAGDEPR